MNSTLLSAFSMARHQYVGLGLAVPAGSLLLISLVSMFLRMRRCSVNAEAEVTAILNGANPRHYVPEYTYDYDGVTYKVHPKDYSSQCCYQAGDRTTLRIDPAKPEVFFDPKRDVRNTVVVSIGLLFFLGLGIVLMLMQPSA